MVLPLQSLLRLITCDSCYNHGSYGSGARPGARSLTVPRPSRARLLSASTPTFYRSHGMSDSERGSKRARVTSLQPPRALVPLIAGADAHGPEAGGAVEHRAGQSYKVPGYVVTEHWFQVPLDYTGRQPGEITIFAREVVAPNKTHQKLPYLLYLQGGPGFGATLPIDAGAWLRAATNHFRVILLDQRGTGRSSAISCRNLHRRGTIDQQAQYLRFFRADSIVKDAENVRKTLVPSDLQNGKWSVLGQSFGGFCAVHYLSTAPEGLSEVLLAGGLPPLIYEENPADDVYTALFNRVITQNRKYYDRFPQDTQTVRNVAEHLIKQAEGGVRLPSGSLLTPRSFQLLGCSGLGYSGGFDRLHFLLETCFDGDEISYRFMKAFESWMIWETNPLYVLLHEPIYSQGRAGNWSAHKIRMEKFGHIFDVEAALKEDRPIYFTGEMVFPWMFDDFKELAPLKDVANAVAAMDDWPSLYDTDILKSNKVPIASATYCEDMYVDFDLAQKSAQHIRGCRQWMTNEYMHSGIKDDGGRIFDKLMAMARDTIPLN